MAFGDIGSVQDTLEYDTVEGRYNRIIKRSNTIAVILYQDTNDDQKVVTVEVNAAGAITNTVKDTLIFNGNAASLLSIAERTPGIYVCYGQMDLDAGGSNLFAATISVGTAGELPVGIIDELNFSTGALYDSSITYLTGSIMVGADGTSGGQQFIRTFTVSEAGAIGAAEIESYRFITNTTRDCDICRVSSTVVAIVTTDSGGELKLWTFTVSGGGNISTPETDGLVIAASGSKGEIINVSGNIFAIAYEGPGGDGFLATIDIDSSGNIGGSVIDLYEFEISLCYSPSLVKISDTIVVVAYHGPVSPGYARTIEIDAAGNITDPYLDTITYEAVESEWEDVCFMQGNIYLIAFKNGDGDAFVVSVDISTPVPTSATKHLMLTGVG